jgi:AraC-like DNA-binding protein
MKKMNAGPIPQRPLNRAGYIIILICLLGLAISCSAGQAGAGTVDLSGTWKLIPRDIPEARSAGFDDTDSPEIPIPGSWTYFITENNDLTSTVWLRRHVHIDAALAGRPLDLSLGRIAVADETFFNGMQVGGEGIIPAGSDTRGYGFAWQKSRHYFIPPQAVKYGGDNVIAVRVFSHVINGIAGSPRITDYRNWSRVNAIENLLSLFVNEGAIILNLILIMLFIVTLDWKSQAWYIVYSILLLLVTSCVHLLILGVPQVDALVRYKVMLGLVVFGHFVFLCAVQEFMKYRVRSLFALSTILLLGVLALIVAAPDSGSVRRYCQPASYGALLVFSLYFSGIYVRSLVRDPLRYWIFILAAIPLTASTAVISYYVMSGMIYRMPLSLAAHLPLVLTMVMVYLILDFKSVHRENDSLTRMLLRKNQVINDLKKRSGEDEAKSVPRERIHDMIEFLDANYTETYDRITLASKFDFNEDYMLQLFKKNTGMTITQYINNRRIAAAKQLLAETDSRIIDIAYHVGFDNITYFHRQFKTITGMTPQAIRRAGRAGTVGAAEY